MYYIINLRFRLSQIKDYFISIISVIFIFEFCKNEKLMWDNCNSGNSDSEFPLTDTQ